MLDSLVGSLYRNSTETRTPPSSNAIKAILLWGGTLSKPNTAQINNILRSSPGVIPVLYLYHAKPLKHNLEEDKSMASKKRTTTSRPFSYQAPESDTGTLLTVVRAHPDQSQQLGYSNSAQSQISRNNTRSTYSEHTPIEDAAQVWPAMPQPRSDIATGSAVAQSNTGFTHTAASSVESNPPASEWLQEKQDLSRARSPNANMPPIETHPAHFAPYADQSPLTPQAHQNSNLASAKSEYNESTPNASQAHEGLYTPPTPMPQPHYLAFAPNTPSLAAHQPGQIPHPNMSQHPARSGHNASSSSAGTPWLNSLGSCFTAPTLCLTALCCPCVVYGKTQYRLSQRAAKADPTNLLGYSACNGHCIGFGMACGLQWLLVCLQSVKVRHLYGLVGDKTSDLGKGCCCCWCALVQQEREVRSREEERRKWAGPSTQGVAELGTSGIERRENMRYEEPHVPTFR